MPAQPEKGLHANRKHSVPTAGTAGLKNCFSVFDILTGKTRAAFASGQSMQVCVDGEEKHVPELQTPGYDKFNDALPKVVGPGTTEQNTINKLKAVARTWPKAWYKPGRVLRVPKVVILSSCPFWSVFWPGSYMYGPSDVIGQDPVTGIFGNYYYFDQWNTTDIQSQGHGYNSDSAAPPYTFAFGNSVYDYGYVTESFGLQDNYLDSSTGSTVHVTPSEYQATQDEVNFSYSLEVGGPSFDTFKGNITPQATPDCIGLNPTIGEGPAVRFSQIVAQGQNFYYIGHQHLIDTFVEVKKKLESNDIDPIFVVIPNWMPYLLYQCENTTLQKFKELLNVGHGGAVNLQPCAVNDSVPCYNYAVSDKPWDPEYPYIFDPRNSGAFNTPQVPWLPSLDPGFGTNVLHLYFGHACMKYFSSSSTFDWQAWPLSPEVTYIFESVPSGTYLGSNLPYYAGRRNLWKSSGFDYGYTGSITAQSLYDTRYHTIVENSSVTYKQNFFNFRNYATRLYTYVQGISWTWETGNIRKDQENTCPATQFYFGTEDFTDFATAYNGIDTFIFDCSQADGNTAHLKFGETTNNFPSTVALDTALAFVYPGIILNIENYYGSIDRGTEQFYQISIRENELQLYDVKYDGAVDVLALDADTLIQQIRDYFKGSPS